MPTIAHNLEDALAPIADGCVLAVPRESSGVPMAATRALIRRGIKRLHLIALPTSTLQADLLIGAGSVETLETSAVSLGEFGLAPRFTAAILKGAIRMKDATCPECREPARPEVVSAVEEASWLEGRTLAEVGVPSYDILRVDGAEESGFFLLAADRDAALGI